MQQVKTVGFIGLGAMGAPMAASIAAAGFDVLVNDIDASRVAGFETRVARPCFADLVTIGQQSDLICMILPNSRVSEAVVFGETGLITQMRPGTIIVDMTSGVASHTREMFARLQTMGVDLIDAPVSGAVARAEQGTLTIMTGGPDSVVDRARGVLEAMGTIYRTGDIGTGHAMKALNNLVSCAGFLIGIEALLIGCRQGLDPVTMVEILSVSTGTNNSIDKKFRQYVLSGRFDSGFPLHMMLKDIENALELAGEKNVPVPFARLCLELWRTSRNMLGPNVDHTAMALAIEKIAGTQIPREDTVSYGDDDE